MGLSLVLLAGVGGATHELWYVIASGLLEPPAGTFVLYLIDYEGTASDVAFLGICPLPDLVAWALDPNNRPRTLQEFVPLTHLSREVVALPGRRALWLVDATADGFTWRSVHTTGSGGTPAAAIMGAGTVRTDALGEEQTFALVAAPTMPPVYVC